MYFYMFLKVCHSVVYSLLKMPLVVIKKIKLMSGVFFYLVGEKEEIMEGKKEKEETFKIIN